MLAQQTVVIHDKDFTLVNKSAFDFQEPWRQRTPEYVYVFKFDSFIFVIEYTVKCCFNYLLSCIWKIVNKKGIVLTSTVCFYISNHRVKFCPIICMLCMFLERYLLQTFYLVVFFVILQSGIGKIQCTVETASTEVLVNISRILVPTDSSQKPECLRQQMSYLSDTIVLVQLLCSFMISPFVSAVFRCCFNVVQFVGNNCCCCCCCGISL